MIQKGDFMKKTENESYEQGASSPLYSEYNTPVMEREEKMADNSLSANDIAVGSLLAGRYGGGYGYGGGAWGGGYGYPGYGPFASPGSNAVRLNRNQQSIEDQADCTRAVLGQNINGIRDNFENLTRSNEFNRVCDKLSDSEFRTLDRLRDQDREINANAREAAKWCCDTQKEIAMVEARLSARMEALSKEGITRDLDRAERELQTQKIISTCGCGCGGGVRPCPPA